MGRVVLMIAVFFAMTAYICPETASAGSEDDGLLVVFWNLENYFDYRYEGLNDSDREFSPLGTRRWTKSRFWRKTNGIAKTMAMIADGYGRFPDVAGFAEVENEFVLKMLANATFLKKIGYRTVHFESPDRRGIDVAIMFRSDRFGLLAESIRRIDGISTRDILTVSLNDLTMNKVWQFIVNHHPSKFGGEKASQPGRMAVMRQMNEVCDSLIAGRSENLYSEENPPGTGNIKESHIIAMGDFNDGPSGQALEILDPRMTNLALALSGIWDKGSIKFDGKWELIDMFFVENGIAGNCSMDVFRTSSLLEKDSRHSGFKPFRTYTGPRYNSGISDHLPIVLTVACPCAPNP